MKENLPDPQSQEIITEESAATSFCLLSNGEPANETSTAGFFNIRTANGTMNNYAPDIFLESNFDFESDLYTINLPGFS